MVQAKLKKFLEYIHLDNWLLAILVFVFILRIPSFFEPFSYGDEMIYLSLGEAIRNGTPLYSGIHDNKPPLLYITAAIAGNVFWFRVILAFWNLATIIIFAYLAKTLFPGKEKLQKVATIIFAILTTIPLLEGNIANSEVFMLAPTLLAFLILLSKKLTPSRLFLSGLFFSMAALYKIPAAFDLPVIVFYWLVVAVRIDKKTIKDIIVKTFYIALGFILPITLTFVWYWLRGAFHEYLVAAFLQNVGYLSSFRPGDVREPFLTRNLPLLIRAGVIGGGIFLLWLKKMKLSKQYIFLTIWLLFGLFAVTLSERPYPHYLIQIVPALSFFFAMLFTLKNKEQTLAIIPITLALIVPVYFRFWYYPTASYYLRFIKYSTNQISKEEYFAGFGGNVVRNYKVADFLMSTMQKEDNLFAWGDNATLYALTKKLPPLKFVADYHINDFSSKEETVNILKNNPPTFVVIHPSGSDFEELSEFLGQRYIMVAEIDGSRIYKLAPLSLLR